MPFFIRKWHEYTNTECINRALTFYSWHLVFLFSLIWNARIHFFLSKTFFSKFQRHYRFCKVYYGNQFFCLNIDLDLLTTLSVLLTIEKVQKDVVQSCLAVAFGSFIVVNKEMLSAKSFAFDWRFSVRFVYINRKSRSTRIKPSQTQH